MDIKGLNGNLGAYQAQLNAAAGNAQRTPENGGKAQQSENASARQSDKVQVSSAAALRTTALSTALSASDIRQEKVDEIRDRLDNGTYTINSRRIAERLVQEESALFDE